MIPAVAEQRQNVDGSGALRWLSRSTDAQILFLLGLVAFMAFANSLSNRFVYDDHFLIEQNYALRDWNYLLKLFGNAHSYDLPWLNIKAMSLDYYRPFTRFLFGLAFQAFGLQPGYWHLLNLLIFCGIVALAYIVIKQLSGRQIVAAIGALLFAVHPIHSEAVAWVNSLVETLHALFFLGGFALYLYAEAEEKTRRGRIFFLGSLTLFLAALLSKETALCFPILVAAYKFIHTESSFTRRILAAARAVTPFLFMVLLYLAWRYFIYGGSLRIGSKLPLSITLLTIPRIIIEYIRMLVIPVGLSPVHSVPLVLSFSSLRFWLPLFLLVVGATLIWLRAPRQVAFASAWILVTMLPVLNIGGFIPDLVVQDRYVFLPSLGFCMVVAMGLGSLLESGGALRRLRPILLTILIAAVIGLLGLTIRQNSFWRSDVTLFARAVDENPNSEFAHCSYAWALYDEGKREEAARHFTLSFRIKNGRSGCSCLGMGNYYADQGNYDQAIQFYERAIELKQGELNLLVFIKLAQAYAGKGQNEKAIELLGKTLTDHPDFQQARYMLEQLTGTDSPTKN